jgi:outer membrane protein
MGKPSSDPRRRLLDAGLKLFANRGYAGTAVQDITEEARVTKPTLYYYFENKEGLFQALVDRAMDERLRLMQEAAPPGKPTVEQLTDIISVLTDYARRHADLLRLTFAIAFAADGEYPTGFKKHAKMRSSFEFIAQIIHAGQERGALSRAYDVMELTQSYFNLIQHSIAIAIIEPKFQKLKPPIPLPPRMEPARTVKLFLEGAAGPNIEHNGVAPKGKRAAKALALVALLLLPTLSLHAQATNTPSTNAPATNAAPASSGDTNQPPAANVVPSAPTSTANEPAPVAGPFAITNSAPTVSDVRPIPSAVKASHPELATVSPIADNAKNLHALDLETCFELTAVRDDSLKISMEDIEVAKAQLSQAIAALWPSFTVNNQQQFLHYRSQANTGFSILGNSTITGNRNYTSQSNVSMTYTLFNGGQNWNNVGANAANIAAKKETLARDYQTIYQDVAQAFYNVLQYEGDMAVQADLIDGLRARVDDLKDRVTLGRSRPSELLQAQTDLANAKVTYESQRGSMNAAKETVAFYTGIPAANLELKDVQKFPNAAQLEGYVQESGTRPDILSQLDSLRQAERNLSSAEGELLPTITANGNFLASQDPANQQIDATMTIEASMPIFDGGLIAGQIHQNHELVRQSRLNVEQLKRTADQDTRTAYANFIASVAQVVVLREAATLAAKNLEAQVDDYRRGVVANLDVLTALQDYQSARIQLHDSNMQARLDLINLHVAAGMAARGPGANNVALPKTVPAVP